MTDPPDPPRLLDSSDVSADLREGLRALKAHVPTGAQLARMSAQLGVPEPPGPGAADGALGKAGATKLLVGAGVVVAGIAALLLGRQPHDDPSPREAVTSLVPAPSPVGAPLPEVPAARPELGARGSSIGPAGSASVATPVPERVAGPAPVAPTIEQGGAEPSSAFRRAAEQPAAPRQVATSSRASSGSIQSAPSALAAATPTEMSLLREARAFLPVDPAEALAQAERHRTLFPHGGLAQEREILAITALVKLGRAAEASARAARFRAAYPTSAYLRQLERILPEG